MATRSWQELIERRASAFTEAAQLQLQPPDLAALANKTVILGVIDIVSQRSRHRRSLRSGSGLLSPTLPAERTAHHRRPTCGMTYLSAIGAVGKAASAYGGARIVRNDLTG